MNPMRYAFFRGLFEGREPLTDEQIQKAADMLGEYSVAELRDIERSFDPHKT